MNKHFAQLPDGTVVTRNSENRTYTHLVAYRPSREHAEQRAMTVHPYMRSNHKYYVACAAGLHEHARAAEGDPQWKIDSAAQSRAKGEAYVAKYGEDLETAMAMQVEEARIGVEKAAAKGYYDRWQVEGWSGRLDLAQKLLARTQGRESIAEARIIEANLK
jgi:hypothetical protein